MCEHTESVRTLRTYNSPVIMATSVYTCNEQKLLLPSGLELMSESSESGALSLSSAARHIDSTRCAVFMSPLEHAIALSLHTVQFSNDSTLEVSSQFVDN